MPAVLNPPIWVLLSAATVVVSNPEICVLLRAVSWEEVSPAALVLDIVAT